MLLLPAFFAYTGMRTQIGLVSGWENWLICGLIILVASLGKFGGTLAAARLAGLDWRTSSALGILMNTRGLMELIVLNIGLDLGVISPTLFAMMVLMALVTTLATTPLLGLVGAERGRVAQCRQGHGYWTRLLGCHSKLRGAAIHRKSLARLGLASAACARILPPPAFSMPVRGHFIGVSERLRPNTGDGSQLPVILWADWDAAAISA